MRTALNEHAEEIALRYHGEPKMRQGASWRYGSHQGSLVVTIRGARQGLWYDFQTGKGGDMLSLMQASLGTAFKDTLQEALCFLGDDAGCYRQTTSCTPVRQKPVSPDTDVCMQQTLQRVQAIVAETQPVIGTLAERYLREHRGIEGELSASSLCYHPHLRNWMTGRVYPALVILAQDDKEQLCGLQAIFLDPQTAKKAALGRHAKLSRGRVGEGAIVHRGLPGSKIALAEGPETALSIATAHPDWTVYTTFGVSNFTKVALKTGSSSVILCADNDGPNSGTAQSIEGAVKTLSKHDREVWVAEPSRPQDKTKWDFNDALVTQGVTQVLHDLDHASLHTAGMSPSREPSVTSAKLSHLEASTTRGEVLTLSPEPMTGEVYITGFESLLRQYVKQECEQSDLIYTMHNEGRRDRMASEAARSQALANRKALCAFAKTALVHPDVVQALEALKTRRPPRLSERGGFKAIDGRLQKGGWVKEDVQAVLAHLRDRALDHGRLRQEDRDRGGRSR